MLTLNGDEVLKTWLHCGKIKLCQCLMGNIVCDVCFDFPGILNKYHTILKMKLSVDVWQSIAY